jgi:hypothetical protein
MEFGTFLTSTVLATLTSTALATVAASLIAGLYGLRAKQREYQLEYYKMILARRVAAYEQLEALVASLKTSVIDETDKKPYHLLFSNDNDWQLAYNLIGGISMQALWLSHDAFKKSQELNYLMFKLKPVGGVIEFGKTNYQKIALLRDDLERILAKDLLTLYDIKHFFKQRMKQRSEFHAVNLNS